MNSFCAGINRIEYRPDAGPEETLVFRHYNPTENVYGRPMQEWLRFSASFLNIFRYPGMPGFEYPIGDCSSLSPFDDHVRVLENYQRRLRATFEFFEKLNVKYYSITDRDLSPDFNNFEETCCAQNEMCDMALDLQSQCKIKPLYFGCDLSSHHRYANGAVTSSDAHVFAYACAQVKRALEMAKRLGAENFLFFNSNDGYHSLAQRQVFRDITHLGNFYNMALQYKSKIGYEGQFVIQPQSLEPSRYQYESDTMSTIAILRHHGLERYFKLHIKPGSNHATSRPYEHDVYMASAFNLLNGVDASSENVPEAKTFADNLSNIIDSTKIMKCVLEQGGFTKGGGVNVGFREKKDGNSIIDQAHSYVLVMDNFARGLRNAAKMLNDGCFKRNLQQRYASFKGGIGEKLNRGESSLEECEEFIRVSGTPEPTGSSRGEAQFENMFNYYVFPPCRQ